MGYSSEELYENKILKENEYSKRKHKEVEERYRDLVEKKPLSVDLEESLAILQEVYANKNSETDLRERFHLSAESFSLEENCEKVDKIDEKQNQKKTLEDKRETDSAEVEGIENNNDGFSFCKSEKIFKDDDKETVIFPEDGVFKAFYEDNIAPMLDRPDFKEIRDFINNGNDFSDEKYEMMVKAFEEKTGIIYSNVGSTINNDKKCENCNDYDINEEKTAKEGIDEDIQEEKELSYDDFMDGAKKMQAIPVRNENENNDDKMGRIFVGGALSGIVALIVIFVLYSIW